MYGCWLGRVVFVCGVSIGDGRAVVVMTKTVVNNRPTSDSFLTNSSAIVVQAVMVALTLLGSVDFVIGVRVVAADVIVVVTQAPKVMT